MNTQDLLNFGSRELDMAGDLLKTFKSCRDDTRFIDSNVRIEFNPNSGNVFLVDEDCNIAMMNGHNLEDFFSCPICGHEGFLENMEHGEDDKECQKWLKDIKS